MDLIVLSGDFYICEVIILNRNHEGYSDPTACEAIKRVDETDKKKSVRHDNLTFYISELPGFRQLRKPKRC